MLSEVQPLNQNLSEISILRLLNLHQELKIKYSGEEEFTNRELEIIHLIADGLNSYEISHKLFISKHTVDTHRKNIYRKGRFKGLRDVILYSILC